MHLVINEVVELQHVHDANRHRPIKLLAGATIKEQRLPIDQSVNEKQGKD